MAYNITSHFTQQETFYSVSTGPVCETELDIYKTLPFVWKNGADDSVVMHAKSAAGIGCGNPGLQLYVDTNATVDPEMAVSCGQLLQVGYT